MADYGWICTSYEGTRDLSYFSVMIIDSLYNIIVLNFQRATETAGKTIAEIMTECDH